jgi:Mg/Co/Ni transporter MgtE
MVLVDSNTKLLQVVSLQKLFLKSNGAQISDLIRFEVSKCVHVSILKITGSKVFYMF